MPAEEVEAQAAAEGLKLVKAKNATGFRGVYAEGGRFVARLTVDGAEKRLGICATAPEAALLVARQLGAARSVTLRLPSGYTRAYTQAKLRPHLGYTQATLRLFLGDTWVTLRLPLGYTQATLRLRLGCT